MARGHWRFRKRPGRGLICTQQRQETLSLVGACGVSQEQRSGGTGDRLRAEPGEAGHVGQRVPEGE